jgi:hypothetical protein
MDTKELFTRLGELGVTEGFAIRNGKIVLWENKEEVPEELAQCIELDEQA